MAASSSSSDRDERLLWGWEKFFEEVSSFLQSISRQYGTANEAFSEYALERIRTCVLNVSTLRDHLLQASDPHQSHQSVHVFEHYATMLSQLLELLRSISHQWQIHIDQLRSQPSMNSYQAPFTGSTGVPGRPRFSISRDQLMYLHSLSFSWTQIASILGVSRMTIYRRRAEFGMLNSTTSNTMSDEELRSSVREMHSSQPDLGETIIWGRLRAMGFHISRERLRRAIRVTDPLHTALRWRGNLTSRRPYSVPCRAKLFMAYW